MEFILGVLILLASHRDFKAEPVRYGKGPNDWAYNHSWKCYDEDGYFIGWQYKGTDSFEQHLIFLTVNRVLGPPCYDTL